MSIESAQTIEEVLLSEGIISQQQFDELNREKIRTGKTSEEILRLNNLAEEDDIVKAKALIIDIEYIDPTVLDIPEEPIKLISESTARKYTLIAFKQDQVFLHVAMKDPEDLLIIQFIERSTNLRVKPYLASESKIISVIEKEYTKTLGKDVNVAVQQAAENTTTRMKESLQNVDQAEDIIKVSPVAQIVSILLEFAVKSAASDIHIEPFENGTRIRYRIDGILQEKFPLPLTIHQSIVARIKILANMPIDERRIPLDGKFKVIFGDVKTDLRVSTIPTVYGEKVVIRLLKDEKTVLTLKQLGMWGKAHHDYNEVLKQTTGIILITGPTGSGKTVTQATSLTKLNSPKVNIITLEDPVEISIKGVNQVQINVKAGLTFASGLRSILRQDPDIIMVGEIRDLETARLAIQASLTGHLVLGTLHTNSAAGAIPRLKDMGIENFLIATTLNISIAQRLTRRICSNCREAYEADPEVVEDVKNVLGIELLQLGLGTSPFDDSTNPDDEVTNNAKPAANINPDKITLYRGKGCSRCNNKGYKGRIGLYEVLRVTPEIQELTNKDVSTDEIHSVGLKQGMISLKQDGYLKSLWGITSIEEVLSVAND